MCVCVYIYIYIKQNEYEVSPHTSQKAMMTMASAKEDVEKGAPLCTIGGMHIGSVTMENDMESLQKNKRYNFNMTQEFHFWILK